MSSLCKVKWRLLKFTRMVIMTFILSAMFDIITNVIKYTQTSASLLKFITSLNIFHFYGNACTKPGKWAVMSLCVRGIDFGSFFDFSIGVWKCSDRVIFFVFHFNFFSMKLDIGDWCILWRYCINIAVSTITGLQECFLSKLYPTAHSRLPA